MTNGRFFRDLPDDCLSGPGPKDRGGEPCLWPALGHTGIVVSIYCVNHRTKKIDWLKFPQKTAYVCSDFLRGKIRGKNRFFKSASKYVQTRLLGDFDPRLLLEWNSRISNQCQSKYVWYTVLLKTQVSFRFKIE